ncbi:MAG: Gfo/Idh/MocA family oxidoreductase [Candidatus Heimdallarchaeota archaeon]|nr:Gfo/Idh/MocA family oxidoreductase [Candidatus Heimdallarchaeota archaeon]
MKVYVIGFGFMGRIHARVLHKMNALGGIIENSDEMRKIAFESYEIPIYDNLDEAIKENNIECIIIAVPTPLHQQITNEVMAKIPNIKSILVEKPFVANLEEYEDNKAIWESIKEKCIVGHIEVYNPVVKKFMEIIQSGEYGQIRTISVQRKAAVQISRLESLSGVVEDVGIHDLDIILRLMNGNLSVYAVSQLLNNKMNSVLAILRSETIQANLHFSREYSGRRRTITVELEKATIKVDLVAQTIEIRGLSEVIGENDLVKVPHGPGSSIKVYGEPLQEEIINLINIAKGIEKPLVTVENGLKALQLAEAIKESIITKNIIKVIIE